MTHALATSRIGAEARTEKRRAWGRAAKVLVNGVVRMEGRTGDISASGISIVTADPIPKGAACDIAVSFYLGTQSTQLIVSGCVVYSVLAGTTGYRSGIQFTGTEPGTRSLIHQIVNS